MKTNSINKMLRPFQYFLLIILFTSCNNSSETTKKRPIFLADREAPVGWSYLEIYEDSTFEFWGNEYQGTVSIKNDTFIFKYNGETAKAGNRAVIDEKYLIYTNGKYLEKLEIKLNELNK